MSEFMFDLASGNSPSALSGALINKISTQLFSADPQKLNKNLSAVHTYIGQMLSHELVSSSQLGSRRAQPILSLESLYGSAENEGLYFNSKGEFNTGSDTAHSPDSDLARVPYNGTAIIPEPRNDENLLISQLHLFWQRVHNKVAKRIRQHNPEYSQSQIVNEAREYVVYLFHRVVVEDFLKLLLNDATFDLYFVQNQQHFLANRKLEQVPLEFSMACFRLGHSMVRPFYELQPGGGKKRYPPYFVMFLNKRLHRIRLLCGRIWPS